MQHYAYSSFGKIVKISDGSGSDVTANPPVKTSYGFTNREHDEESGMMYYRARFYSPEIGRFISSDPHPGEQVTPITIINKYIYVGNNPQNLTDPTGMSWLSDLVDGDIDWNLGKSKDLRTAFNITVVIVAAVYGSPIYVASALASMHARDGELDFSSGSFAWDFSKDYAAAAVLDYALTWAFPGASKDVFGNPISNEGAAGVIRSGWKSYASSRITSKINWDAPSTGQIVGKGSLQDTLNMALFWYLGRIVPN